MTASKLPQALYTAAQVRELDVAAIEIGGVPGIQLMKRAGRVSFEVLTSTWPQCARVIVCCGSGNNAGDGYVVAALAAQRHFAVEVLAVTPPEKLVGDAAKAYQYALQEGVMVTLVGDAVEFQCSDDTVIVDALLGTGLHGVVREKFAMVIQAINNSGLPVLAVDVPSGICSDTGRVLGCAVKAESTVSFIGLKQGLLSGRAPAFSGTVIFDDLQTSHIRDSDYLDAVERIKPQVIRIALSDYRRYLAEREADAHKGQFGHVLVIGGDTGYGGAAAMAAEMATRSGAGLTSVATRPEHMSAILARLPEVMVSGVPSGQALEPLLARPTILVVGPGLGTSPWSEQMLQQANKSGLPMIVDADALNLLAQGRVIPEPQRDNWILTPHPGEAARLLGITRDEIQADRFAAAKALQNKYGGVVVLKGAGTLIANGSEILLADVGNPGMASGGMGDVLSGLLGGLLAQGLGLSEAAGLGVCAHGDAADLAVEDSGQRGLLATDLIPYIRELLN